MRRRIWTGAAGALLGLGLALTLPACDKNAPKDDAPKETEVDGGEDATKERLAKLIPETNKVDIYTSEPEMGADLGEDPAARIAQSLPEQAEVAMIEGDPAVEKLGEQDGVTATRVGGLTVLHKPTPANEVVSAQLYFVGGASGLDEATTGLERLTLSVATEGGTDSTPKDAFNARLDSVGASIGSFSDRDYSGIAMKTVVPYFDDVWELYTQSILEPALPKEDIELVRQRQLTQIAQIFDSPDSYVSYLATQALFEGHPYRHTQLGTEQTVSAFTREHLQAWHRGLLDPSKMVLVVVGNVPNADLIDKVKGSLGKLAPGEESAPQLDPVTPGEEHVVYAERDLPTNYVFGLFPGPAPGHQDYPAMVVAMDYLSDKLFEEVRTKRNLTYAVSARLSSRRANYGYLYVTAVDPEKTLDVIFDEVTRLKNEELTEAEITRVLNVFLTGYYMAQETNASQASELAEAYIITGDWRNTTTFLERVRAVTPADIKRVATTYLDDYHVGVVGPYGMPMSASPAQDAGGKAPTKQPEQSAR